MPVLFGGGGPILSPPETFPTLSTGSVAKYDVQRSNTFRTGLAQFSDDTEQRWTKLSAPARFVLHYTDLAHIDMILLQDFFYASLGRFDSSWSLTFNGVLYIDCAFEDDIFEAVEDKPNVWTVTLRVRQTYVS